MQSQLTKNLLFFQHDASLYGASQSLLTLLEHLVKNQDLQILVLLPKNGLLEDRLTAIGVNYEVVPFPRCIANQGISFKKKFIKAARYVRDEVKVMPVLIKLAKEFRADAIYTNTSVISIGFKLSRFLRIPHIWHIREFGDIDFQYLPNRAAVNRRILKSESAIFVSNALMSQWVKSKDSKFQVVHNGIVSKTQNVKPLKKPEGSKWRFGILGPVIPGKGQHIAVNAFLTLIRSYPECELHLFGGMGDKSFIHKLNLLITRNSGNGKVFFHDFVADNKSIYQTLDVVLSCSVKEGFGRTVVEAMSRGIPVIANASGGPAEIIKDGKTGLLYNATYEDLFEKMQLLMKDNQLYNLISEEAIQMAKRNFSIDQYVSRMEHVIMQAIGDK